MSSKMSSTLSLTQLVSRKDIRGLRVLIRADLNVPLTHDGSIRDSTRIKRLLPSFKTLSANGARIGILSHFGRPKGQTEKALSLKPIAQALNKEIHPLLGKQVSFAEDCIGTVAHQAMQALSPGELLVFENTRFHPEEETNDAEFAKALAENGDVYVNDAFSTAHRAHASTEGIAHFLPSYIGLAMQAELDTISLALEEPKRPLIALVGGSKVSSKIDILFNLIKKVDKLVIGGGMANTFLAAQGMAIGQSLYEKTMLNTAHDILTKARTQECEILLPEDCVLNTSFTPCATPEIVDSGNTPDDKMILDAGPKTIATIKRHMEQSGTLVWNGPLGAFELSGFDTATNETARFAGNLTKQGKLVSIAGGGDTLAALNHAGAADDFTYVSTAGGAFLEWLEGKKLPGVKALENMNQNNERG